ncbi:MAG: carboxypeptidase regulatory-like domain-containing protein [Acidobacteriota bacterium]
MTRFLSVCAAVCILLLLPLYAQTSASLSGLVQDTTGAMVPGANVTLTEPSKNLKLETITSDTGLFNFPVLQPGNYTITVEMSGFKTVVKSGIILETNQKQSAGTIVMEVGEVTSTIQVSADAGQLQVKSRSGEQGEIVTGRQVRELAINGRNYLDLVKIVPGVVTTGNFQVAGPGGLSAISINGTRTNQHNLTIDGSTNVDTGSNGTQHVALNIDAIEEFQVLSSNYQAEYGRSGGGEIKITTRSGTKDFHGTAYLFHRHEGMNANTFFRNADKTSRAFYRYNYFGYNIGGPVKLGNFLKDKMYFFWGQEWHKQFVPVGVQQVRMPTDLEVNGDFSQTRDGSGNDITIKDPLTGKPFENEKIPANRINTSGQNILKLFNRYINMPEKMPLFNHQSQESINYPRREENIRVDYNITENLRMFARFTQDSDEQIMPYGVGWTSGQNFPLTPTIFKQGPARNASLNITWVINNTMTNEFVFGPSQNNLTLDPVDPDAATFKGIGLTFTPPYPYSPYQFVNINFSGYGSYGVINNYTQFPYKNSNTTFDFYDNLNKIWGSHSFKTGIYYQRQRKDQAAGTSMTINFSNNVNNPNNAGHPLANALLGNFDTLTAPNRPIGQGQYRSTNLEWYVQDNWRVTPRLTVDYGIRFSYIGPQYDDRDQERYFDPNAWDPAKAVRLYRPDKNGFAYDPVFPEVTGLPKYLIGRIVPGSGEPFNGMVHIRGGFKKRPPQIGPALGFAFDMFGNAKTVLRGGFRTAYDRVSGNTSVFPAVGQPPVYVNPQFFYGNLDTVGAAGAQVVLAPSNVHGIDREGKIPMVHSFSLQIQHRLPHDTVVSLGYVGSVSSHLWQTVNLNYSPYGELFTKAAQDPAQYPNFTVPDVQPNLAQVYIDKGLKFDGSKAFQANFLKKYPGYGTIQYRGAMGSANYHSMQAMVQRRFGRGLTYAIAYTWGRAMDTANGDGDYQNPVCSRCYDYRRASFDRKHNLAINYVWNLPAVAKHFFDNALGRAVFDNWQLSGISQFQTGSPAEPNFGLVTPSGSGLNTSQRVLGSWTEGPRIQVIGDPVPTNQSRTNWLNYSALQLPEIGQIGGNRSWIDNPGLNIHDISIYKNFPLWSEKERFLQFRLEMFNAFNHPNFTGFNSGMTFQVADSAMSNYNAVKQASPQTVRGFVGGISPPNPNTYRLGRGNGEVNSQPGYVSANRVIELAMKLYF